MKPSAQVVLDFLKEVGESTTVDIIRNCPTVTPSKRLSELYLAGKIAKRREGKMVLYRANEGRA